MDAIINGASIALNYIVDHFKSMGINDIVDIICVSVLIYFVIKFAKDRRAGKLAAGIVILILLKIISDIFSLNSMAFIISNVFQAGLIAIIVVFQPELRSALETLGREPLRGLKSIGEQKDRQSTEVLKMIGAVSDACVELSNEKTGAIIVIERTTKLGDIIKSGTVIDAAASQLLIRNLFYEGAPLHDGAVIIREGRLYAAGCFLPLTMNSDVTKDLGSRHRASLGMSENSDAVVVVVSEETGIISIAIDGNLKRGYTKNSLMRELKAQLIKDDGNNKLKKIKRRYEKSNKSEN